ncbi:MAG: DUF1007 family protein [Rhodospirillaceae bacterium]|nr:DUF1007 family protein [Rhodospirillaceae bacterium]
MSKHIITHPRRYLTLVASILAACAVASPARAHPHSWIDLRVSVLFDDEGRITGLHENWLFDEAYTTFILDHFAKGKKHALKAAEFRAIAAKIMTNLKPYHYFTKASDGGKELVVATIEVPEATVQGERFDLSFTIKLQSPTKEGHFAYEIFDPTYYIELLHAEGDGAIRLMNAPSGCTHHLIKPNPSMDAVVRAAGLDPSQTTDTKLGELFAERVTITCR